MTLMELYHELKGRGIELRRTDNGIQARPAAEVDDTIRAAIREHREMLLLYCEIEAARGDRIWDLDYFLTAFPNDVETALLGAWFWTYAHTLPMEPFQIEEGRLIEDPLAFYRELARAISFEEHSKHIEEAKRDIRALLSWARLVAKRNYLARPQKSNLAVSTYHRRSL